MQIPWPEGSGHVMLIVGLGNPGERYSLSRHNAGFIVLENLSAGEKIDINKTKFDSRFGKGVISGVPVVLSAPQTFMNLSGIAVGKLVRFFKVNIEDVIVVHDDLDLPFSEIRIKKGGGDGGHNGLNSVINHLGGSEFIRIRLGIGKPDRKEMVESYVLEHFSREEMRMLPDVITRACDVLVEVVSSGAQAAMNKFNAKVSKNSSKEV